MSNEMPLGVRNWFLSNAGDGIEEGELKDLSYNGYDARLVYRGGKWYVSSWSKSRNQTKSAEASVINTMRSKYGLN